MGLDTVELVMAAEEEFGVEIPDAEAEKIVTMGDFLDCIERQLPSSDGGWSKRTSDQVWRRLREITHKDLGVEMRRIVKSAAIIDDFNID